MNKTVSRTWPENVRLTWVTVSDFGDGVTLKELLAALSPQPRTRPKGGPDAK